MSNVWVAAAIVAGVVLALALAQLVGRRREEPVAFADEREERLTNQLAATLGCSPAQALPSLRQELHLAPGQSDETLLKRAAYHFRRNMPEGTTCGVWRDRAPG
jgi:hypothetical protein